MEFYSSIKGKVGLIFAKADSLRIRNYTDGSPVTMVYTWAAHTSHTARPLIISSLAVPVLKCTGGQLIQSPLALAPCCTLFLLLSHALSPR